MPPRPVQADFQSRDLEAGELPDDLPLVGGIVKNICYANARDYLRLPGVE